MKLKLYAIAFVGTTLFSCSSDSTTPDLVLPTPADVYTFDTPLTTNKYWTYDVESQSGNTRDSLYISGDTLIGNITYKKFKVKDDTASGFYSSSLKNNGVRELNSKLLLSGEFSLSSGQNLPTDLNIEVSDFIILDKDAEDGELLSTVQGTIQQDFNGYPITINYTLKSIAGENLEDYISNNVNYSDVKTTKIVVRASMTTLYQGFTITVMQDQEVLNSIQYLANGIGVVYTKTDTQYQLETLPVQLPIPSSGSQTQEEFLSTHN